MNVGIIGSGDVGQTLARGFAKHGHTVTIGSRDPGKLADFAKENPKVRVGSFAETAKSADAIVLAVKGSVASEALRGAGVENLSSKPILDATNPISDAPPAKGVLGFFTSYNESLMERLQKEFSSARFVKCFNSVGADLMVNPQFKEGKPTMFICGNDAAAKKTATGFLDQFGWDSADMGPAEAARAIEPLCILWCIPGFARNEWTHAFKLLRQM